MGVMTRMRTTRTLSTDQSMMVLPSCRWILLLLGMVLLFCDQLGGGRCWGFTGYQITTTRTSSSWNNEKQHMYYSKNQQQQQQWILTTERPSFRNPIVGLPATATRTTQPLTRFRLASSTSGYIPPEKGNDKSKGDVATTKTTKSMLYPKVGDLVRFYDLDGGKVDGQVLVGRIRFIQKNLGKEEGSGWTVELVEMDDLGQGYYTDYGSGGGGGGGRLRWNKKKPIYRDLLQVSPLAASFVRSENAYKVPTTLLLSSSSLDGGQEGQQQQQQRRVLVVKAEQYNVENYMGPFGGNGNGESSINTKIVEADGLMYNALKGKLFRMVALTGAVGTIIANWSQEEGMEFAIIYFVGVLSSLGYLFFLSIKTDTLGTEQQEQQSSLLLGKNVSNL